MAITENSTTILVDDDAHANAGGDGKYSDTDLLAVLQTQLGGAATFAVTAGSPTIVRAGGTALTANDVNRLLFGPGITRDSKITAQADPNATVSPNANATVAAAVLTASSFARIDGNAGNIPLYRVSKTIQNGDGASTLATTIELKDVRLVFDTARTFTVSTVGASNRWTKLGEKVQGAAGKPSGRRGVVIDANATMTIRGNVQIYASVLRTNAGNLQILPGSNGLTAELVGCQLASATSITVGAAAGRLQLIYNVEFILGTALGNTITNLGADVIERIWVVMNGGSYGINTGGDFAIKEPTFIGTPAAADCRYTGSSIDAHLIDVVWSGNGPKTDFTIAGRYLVEWFTFNTASQNILTGAIVPNVPIRVVEESLNEVVFDGTTGIFGGIVFNSDPDLLARTVFDNAVKVERHTGSPTVAQSLGPWRLEVNLSGAVLPDYFGYTEKFTWPYSNLPSTFGRQYRPLSIPVRMIPKSAAAALGKEEWRSLLA